MIWALVAVAAAIILFVIVRRKAVKPTQVASETFRAKAALLPPRERVQMAEDIRGMAFEGYDRVSSAAKAAGKNPQFANEGGVLDAIYCVLANSNEKRADASLRPVMQMEGVPFNHLEPSLARSAVAEYLVWKWLPNSADKEVLRRAFEEFRMVLEAKSNDGDEPAYGELLTGNKYDWQELLRLTSTYSEGTLNA